MSQPFRLAEGGRVDRSRPLAFTFDGRRYEGFPGDTLASALLANGVHLTARSFKERRPRGILAAGSEEAHALVSVGEGSRRTPGVRATLEPLAEGLVAASQHGWPALGFDLGAANGLFHALLPAGFYNKTFKWPSWETYEPTIRRLAAAGRAPRARDADAYLWRNAHCDLLVAGGGAAGLVAALVAARAGARVVLAEGDAELGGGLLAHAGTFAGQEPGAWIAAIVRQLAAAPNVRLLPATTVVGAYDHGVFAALETAEPGRRAWRERWWRIRARACVVATGAIEQPLVFPHNDRPGILLAGAAKVYLQRYAVAVGRRVLVATNNDSAYRVALELRQAGIDVVAVAEARATVRAELAAALAAAGIPLATGTRIAATSGRRRVKGAELAAEGGVRRRVDCDAIAMSGGWNPATQLWGQNGGKLRFDARRGALVPAAGPATMRAVGGAAGTFDPRAALDEAAAAAAALVGALGIPATIDDADWHGVDAVAEEDPVGVLGYDGEERRDRAWVDFAHDVTAADIDLAVRENFVSVEHLKRYTTVGMAVDQGKTSNLNALAILAARTGRAIGEVGTTKFRPPVVPVTLGAIAGGRLGRFLRPTRLLPSHDRQVAAGAHFDDFGFWRRPATYPRAGESEAETIAREVLAVRRAAGIFEASPLGKILVRGADAGRFLDFVYANAVSDLAPGRVRYGVMLTERGIVMDDGVCGRLGPEEFWVGSSSGAATRVALWLEEWLQCQWTDWRVVTTDLTSQWATVTVAGPRARDIVAALGSDVDLSPAAFPHMGVRSGRIGEVPCRIFRVSFTGELTFEVSVPASHGAALWDALVAAGEPHGAMPLGVEALLVLRTEKGYLHVGADTDGTTVPDDIGFGAAIARKPGDFVGRRSLTLAENVRPDRLQLVGLRCVGPAEAFVAGAHLLDGGSATPPVESAGYLTSACWSPTLGAHVGLGMLRRGRARSGEFVTAWDAGRTARAEVVSPVHYDPRGERLHA